MIHLNGMLVTPKVTYSWQKDDCVVLAHYTEKLKILAESYFKEATPILTTQRCCVSLDDKELSIIGIDRHTDVNEVLFHDKIKYDDIKSLPLVIRGISDKYKLQQTPIYWLLNPDEYQLNLMESLPVPENELRTALGWRVRSLIQYPVEEAALEYFMLPAKKNSPNSPLIGVVTAQKSKLMPAINLFKDCGLQLTNIDIPELAIERITALYENDEKSSAFLYFCEKYIILNISSRKTLYFTRRIMLEAVNGNAIDIEKLSLEILRYFDFFRVQWRLSSPSRIFIAGKHGDLTSLAKSLSERIQSSVETYSLTATLLTDKEKKVITENYLLDYGCLLPQDSENVKTRN